MPPREPDKNAGEEKRHRLIFSARWWLLLLLLCVLAIATSFIVVRMRERQGPGAGQKGPPPAPAIAVSAAEARTALFNIYITGLGTVTPVYTVTVHTRVDGQLMEVLYREGQMVEKDALLARLDSRPFEAQLLQAEGQLARDEAQLKEARIDLERFRALWAEDSIAKQQYDLQASLVGQLEGAIKTDRGAIETARVNIVYCRIAAPITGRVGLRLVDPGNIVHTTDTNGIVVITQVHPMTVIFPIAEDGLPRVRTRLKAGETLQVEAFDRDMTQRLATGTLLTIDNQIDTTTGTVRLRAIFSNEKDNLFPNQFVNARLLVDQVPNATVIPVPAIQRGPEGTFVYVVNVDRTVAVRPVTVGAVQGGDAWIRQGLSPGDLAVVEGTDRLHPGAAVQLKPQTAGAGPAARKVHP